MDHAPLCTGGEVPDVLHPWYGTLYVPKCGRLRPQAQHRPLLGTGVPPRHDPEVASTLPWVTHADTDIPTKAAVSQRFSFRLPPSGSAQETRARARECFMDIRGDLEYHRR